MTTLIADVFSEFHKQSERHQKKKGLPSLDYFDYTPIVNAQPWRYMHAQNNCHSNFILVKYSIRRWICELWMVINGERLTWKIREIWLRDFSLTLKNRSISIQVIYSLLNNVTSTSKIPYLFNSYLSAYFRFKILIILWMIWKHWQQYDITHIAQIKFRRGN